MALPGDRPLLLLDVDGPLNPYAAKPSRRPPGYATHRMLPDSWVASSPRPRASTRPLRVWLNPGHGPALLGLPCPSGPPLLRRVDPRIGLVPGPARGPAEGPSDGPSGGHG